MFTETFPLISHPGFCEVQPFGHPTGSVVVGWTVLEVDRSDVAVDDARESSVKVASVGNGVYVG